MSEQAEVLAELRGIRGDLTGLNTKITELDEKVAALDQKLGPMATNIIQIQATMSATTNRVRRIDSVFDHMKAALNASE